MRRARLASAIVAVLCALVLGLSLVPTASAATVVLGRRLVDYTSGPASWVASAQGQLVDTNGNGINDSLQGRGAVLERVGVLRGVIYSVIVQRNLGTAAAPVWQNAIVQSTDVVGGSYIGPSFTEPRRLCGTDPTLQRQYRVVNNHAVRRVDGLLAARTTLSFRFTTRALANDPACPETPPPTTADLSVAKTVVDVQDPEGGDELGPIAAIDDTFEYRVTVSNAAGGATATDVDVADDYPSDLDPATVAAGSGCAVDATTGDVTCELASLAPGTSHTFTITGRTNGSTGESFTNSVSLVELDQVDPDPTDNSVDVTTTTA